jgi:hypothetical protein
MLPLSFSRRSVKTRPFSVFPSAITSEKGYSRQRRDYEAAATSGEI